MGLTLPKTVANTADAAASTPADGPRGISSGEYEGIKAKYDSVIAGNLGKYAASSLLTAGGHHELSEALRSGMSYEGFVNLVKQTEGE